MLDVSINYGVSKNKVLALNSLHLQTDTFVWYAGLLKTEGNQTVLESLTEKRSIVVHIIDLYFQQI